MKRSGPERDEGIGGWRKLEAEDLHKIYSFSNIIKLRRME
jgi:hypothetical protein